MSVENKSEMPSRNKQLESNEDESESLLDSEKQSKDSLNQDASNSSRHYLILTPLYWIYSSGRWLFLRLWSWRIWSIPLFYPFRWLFGQIWRTPDVSLHSPVKVHVLVSGPTQNTHQTFINKLDMSLEESSLEDCSVILVFCPVSTRMGTDMETAVREIPGDKPVILVLMHHSYNPDHIDDIPITPPRSNVVKVVQCVFHDTAGLLECELNERPVRAVRAELQQFKKNTVVAGHVGGLRGTGAYLATQGGGPGHTQDRTPVHCKAPQAGLKPQTHRRAGQWSNPLRHRTRRH